MIGPILRRARKGNSRRIIMEARLPHFSHNPRPAPFSAASRNTNQKPARFSSFRVGAYCICPTSGHARGRMDRKIAIFQVARVGRNSIRPTNGHIRGRMNPIPIRFLIPRIKMNIKPAGFSIPRMKRDLILIRFSNPRPKMNLNLAGFSNPRTKEMAVPDA